MRRKIWSSYLYILPAVLFMFMFVAVPVIYSFSMSFFKIPSLGATWEFFGLKNYQIAFSTVRFWNSMGRTLLFGGFSLITGIFFGLLLSLLVCEHRFLNFYRYIFYIPAVVSAIVLGRVWSYVLTPTSGGLLNSLLMSLGIVTNPVNWMGNDKLIPVVVMGTGLYGVGGGMTLVLFTTALNNISKELLECAKLEGASPFRIALCIKIPLIRPVLASWISLSIIGSFKAFESIYALFPNAESAETIAVLLFKNSSTSTFGYGMASSMGTILTLIVMFVMLLYLYLPKWLGRTES